MKVVENLQKKLVVLIDADNTSPRIIVGLMEEIAKYGIAIVKRIYGDWTKPQLQSWKDILLEYAISPIQQFGYTVGKNSTDSAMIIDAMDLLYTGKFDGFCIVSSDSDFTRLASRIREAGLTVYGFGEKKTPKPLISACDKFIYTEILKGIDEVETPQKKFTTKELKCNTSLVNLLRSSVSASMDENGWSFLGSVGQHINNQSPEFDPRNYGYKKLKDIIKAIALFEMDESRDNQIYIRDKRNKKSSSDE